MALTISDTLAGYVNESLSAFPASYPTRLSTPKLGAVTINHPLEPLRYGTDANGAFTAILPWPSEVSQGGGTWTIPLPDGSKVSGAVPEGVSGPLTLAQLVTSYSWTRAAARVLPEAPSAVLPSGWDNAYRASLSAGGITPIVLLADSVGAGRNSTNFAATSWWLKTVAALQSRYGNAGRGFASVWNDQNFNTAWTGSGTYLDQPSTVWGMTGAWSLGAFGLGARNIFTSTLNASATATFTGSGVDIWLEQSSTGGAFTATIDGVAIDANGVLGGAGGTPTSLNGANNFTQYKFAILSNLPKNGGTDNHTLVITNTGGAQIVIEGITVYNGNPGVLPQRLAKQGDLLTGYANSSAPAIDCFKVSIEQFTPVPALVIASLIINDMSGLVPFSSYEAALCRVADSAKAAGASLLVLIPWLNTQGGVGWGATVTPFASRYIKKVYELQRRYGYGIVDVNGAWDNLGAAYCQAHFMSADAGHPGDPGHADIAQRVLGAIG